MKRALAILLLALFDDPHRIAAWLAENKVPAVGIGVIRDGQLKEVKVYGELRKGVSAPYDTIFNVASLTKPVVTNLTLRLVSMGKWDLDEPLAHYWVDPDIASDPRSAKLTTRHVLSHQTGFPNWRWQDPSKKLAFQFDPGTKFQYSGEGFEYLRRALEKKFGQPLAQLAASTIFQPLGMKDTQFTWCEHTDESRFARWHDQNGENTYTDDKTTTANAADNLLTTVEDYGRFAAAVLNGDGLSKAVFDDMVRPHAAMKGQGAMGLGWEIQPNLTGGEYALIHSGSDDGVKTLVILLPKSKQGLIVFTNGDNGFNLFEKVITEELDLGKEIMGRAQ
jgi:CubicO group peptidase (beta-lactamase class C family)